MYVCVFLCNKGYKRIVCPSVPSSIRMRQNLGCTSSANGILYIPIFFEMYSINGNHNHNLSFVSIYEDTTYAIIKIRIYLYAREMCTIDHTIYILIFAYIAYIRVHIRVNVCMCVCICARIRIYTEIIPIDPSSCTYIGVLVPARNIITHTTLFLSRALMAIIVVYIFTCKNKSFFLSQWDSIYSLIM